MAFCPRLPDAWRRRWRSGWRLRRQALLFGAAAVLLPWLLTAPAAAPWRALLRRRHRAQIAVIAGRFEPPYYLGQIGHARLRRAAARQPLLHYLLLGRHLDLAPCAAFEARRYRLETRGIPRGCSPFAHYLAQGASAARAPADRAAAGGAGTVGEPVALLLDHARGGGSSRYLELYRGRLRGEGYAPLALRRAPGRAPLVVAADGGPLRWFDLFEQAEAFVEFARGRGVRRLVVNHLIDLPMAAFDWLPRLAQGIGADYEVLVHDYFYLCPRVNLVDAGRRYCGIRPAADCGRCIAQAGSSAGRQVDVAAWRRAAQRLLGGAVRVVVPSADLRSRLAPHFPRARFEVHEPEEDRQWLPPLPPRIARAQPLRLAVVGALNLPKGFDVVAALARLARARRAPLSLSLIGASEDDARLRRYGVAVRGHYREGEADALLRACAPHAVLLPAIWPETWSFVQSIALRNRLPVIAFDHGAIAQRLRRLGHGVLLPPALAANPAALLEQLLELRGRYLDTAVAAA